MAGSRPAAASPPVADGPWPEGQAARPSRTVGVCESAQIVTPQKPLMGWSPSVLRGAHRVLLFSVGPGEVVVLALWLQTTEWGLRQLS